MSAHVLQYPKKPNEVCDDLESIVYVVVEGLLRFYPHSHSPPIKALSTLHAVQPQDDGDRDLAMYVQSTFYEARAVNRYFVGGKAKLRQIEAGKPDFNLKRSPDNSQIDLEKLLWRLYGLIKKHYAAIPLDELKQFSVSDDDEMEDKLEEHRNYREQQDVFDLFGPDDEDGDEDGDEDEDKPSSGASSTASEAERPKKRVLDTHRKMVAEFTNYLRDPITKQPKPHFTHPKTEDQFAGLSRTALVKDIGPSSGSALGSSSMWSIATPQIPTLDVTQELNDAEAEQDVFAAGVEEVIYDLSHLDDGDDDDEVVKEDDE